MDKIIALVGTTRDNSNTLKALQEQFSDREMEVVELHRYHIAPYRYDVSMREEDDFLDIIDKALAADVIIFATPVYWYSMSGVMKDFFDRLTEITETELKHKGKALAGKKVWLLASGGAPQLPEGFEVPFRETSRYFNMLYEKSFYFHSVI